MFTTTKGTKFNLDFDTMTAKVKGIPTLKIIWAGFDSIVFRGDVICRSGTGEKVSLRVSSSTASKIDAMYNEYKTKKYMKQERELETKIPGYHRLTQLIALRDNFYDDMTKFMDNENGIAPPISVSEEEITEFIKEHPKAYCYIRCERYQQAKHSSKSAAGDKAKKLLLDGGSVAEANMILDNWLTSV